MMTNSIYPGKIGLSNIQNGYLVNETKDRVDNLEKCIDVIEKLEDKQDNINESFLKRIEGICSTVEDDETVFNRFADLYFYKEERQDREFKELKEKCDKFKKNTLIGFIGCGLVDVVLCILIILQMYV